MTRHGVIVIFSIGSLGDTLVAWPDRAVRTPGADINAHWHGILNAFDSRLNNGGVEALNGLIQAAKARARGYRTCAI